MFSTHTQVVGAEQPESLTSVLTALAELRGSANFSLEAEVDQVVGRAVAAMGPARLLAAIPLNITGKEEMGVARLLAAIPLNLTGRPGRSGITPYYYRN